MPILPLPSAAAEREHEQARRHPERETLELVAAGAAQVLGVDHGVTKALATASITMGKVDLWHARFAVKMLLPGPAPGDCRGGGSLTPAPFTIPTARWVRVDRCAGGIGARRARMARPIQ